MGSEHEPDLRADTEPALVGWKDLSDALPPSSGWMHSGAAVSDDDTIFCAHPDGGALLAVSEHGTRIVPVDLSELHGISLGPTIDTLVVADPGYRMDHDDDLHYAARWTPGRAVVLSPADGTVLLELEPSALDAYATETWRPTSIDVDREPIGSGDIWVADGYGANLVHRFDRTGRLLLTVGGPESAVTFDCPHGLLVRRRDRRVEVLVADRGNHRIVVLDENGDVQRVFGTEHLDSPSGLTELHGDLYVSELFGGVARFDRDERFVETVERKRPRSHLEPEWPNHPGRIPGTTERPHPGQHVFNSPHGIAAGNGYLILTEWLIGGRLLRIVPGGSE